MTLVNTDILHHNPPPFCLVLSSGQTPAEQQHEYWQLPKSGSYTSRTQLQPTPVKASTRHEHNIEAGWNEIVAELQKLRSLEQDWNGEDAPPIVYECIQRATWLLAHIVNSTKENKTTWISPKIFPSIDGGVHLYWKFQKFQMLFAIEPDQNEIEYQKKVSGEPSSRWSVGEEEAVKIALDAISML